MHWQPLLNSVRPSFNAQSCPAADNCWQESLIYPHNIHEVSRTLGNLSHKTGLWLGLFNTASVKWLKVNHTPVRSERNCSTAATVVAFTAGWTGVSDNTALDETRFVLPEKWWLEDSAQHGGKVVAPIITPLLYNQGVRNGLRGHSPARWEKEELYFLRLNTWAGNIPSSQNDEALFPCHM